MEGLFINPEDVIGRARSNEILYPNHTGMCLTIILRPEMSFRTASFSRISARLFMSRMIPRQVRLVSSLP